MPPRILGPLVCPCCCGVLGPWMERCLRDPRSAPRGRAVEGGVGGMPSAQRLSARSRTGMANVHCLAAFVCRYVRRAISRRLGLLVARLARHPSYVCPPWVVLARLGAPLAPVLLSAAGVPPHPLWPLHPCPPWDLRVVAGRAVRVARLRRLFLASRHGFGHLVRVLAWAGFPCGLPVFACYHSPPRQRAMLPASRPPDAAPPSGARGLASSPAGRRPGRCRAPGLGPGPGWGPGNCQMALSWAVLPVRLVGLGVDGVPVRPAPGLMDGTLGSTCRVPLESGDWRSQWGCGRGGAWCRALVASVGVAVRVCVGGPSDGVYVGLAVGWTAAFWCGWGSELACVVAAGRWPRVDA